VTPNIVAVWPFWSQGTAMNWDSNWNILRLMLPALAKARPSWVFAVFWPMKSAGEAWRWHDDGTFSLLADRVARVPWPYHSSMRLGTLTFDTDRWTRFEDEWAPLVYWMHQVESAWYLRGGKTQSWSEVNHARIVAQHHWIAHRSLPYGNQFARLWAQMGGTLEADVVVANSQYTRWMMEDAFAPYLAEQRMAEIMAKTRVLLFGLVGPELADQPIHDATGRPTFVWNHRFESYKGVDDTAAVIRALKASGRQFEVLTTVGADQRVHDFPFDRASITPDHREYIRNIAIPAVNTLNSKYETFNLSMLDSIALGHLPVVPNGLTFPELVPDGYPFLFRDRDEQFAMLARIVDTWPAEHERWSPILREHARTRFALDAYIEDYATLLTDPRTFDVKPHTKTAIDRFAARLPRGEYGPEDLRRRYHKIVGLGTQAATNRRVVRDMLDRGAEPIIRNGSLLIRWP
jgi:glycosyltransferase involved in cell wall biosynthesis